MTTSQLCLFIVALLPFSMTFLAKARKGYDNRAPRDYSSKAGAPRAAAAHQNGWEALALFTAARWWWHGTAAERASRVDQLAMAFVAIRVVYMLMYLLNWASLRSLVWFGGMACVVALFFAAP